LRFNFRGVGQSRGNYDHGQGESRDVASALDYLAEQGKTVIDLAGYSFGAWVNASAALPRDRVRHMVMVSPPVAFLDFQGISRIPQLRLVIAGGRDQFAPLADIEALLPGWNSDAVLESLAGADHFYVGYTDQIECLLISYLRAEHGKIHS
jgi:alpha/beta superfamily hydrolase